MKILKFIRVCIFRNVLMSKNIVLVVSQEMLFKLSNCPWTLGNIKTYTKITYDFIRNSSQYWRRENTRAKMILYEIYDHI